MFKHASVIILALFSIIHGTVQADDLPTTIDVVYTWVDGSDPLWLAAKAKAQRKKTPWQKTSDADVAHRYQDREELRYSLRSIYKNIANLGNIFIVTMDQRPKWLVDHPKVRVVSHSEIIDAKWLPTFNSNAIESALHHIPGLGEYFLYLNDDFFVGQPCTINDFFQPNGKLRFNVSNISGPTGTIKPYHISYQAGLLNTNNLLNKLFGTKPRNMLVHTPQPLRVSWMYEAEQMFPNVFLTNLGSPFRNSDTYALTNGFLHHLWQEQGRAEQCRPNLIETNYSCGSPFSAISNQRKLSMLEIKRPQFFCIEDNSVRYPEKCDQPLKQWLNKMFPEPAPWEQLEAN